MGQEEKAIRSNHPRHRAKVFATQGESFGEKHHWRSINGSERQEREGFK